MKKHRLVSVASLILVMSASIALAAEAVKIGGVEVPADSPLARKEHPRLLFTNAELPAIRRRAKLPGVRADLQLIEEMSRKDPDRLGATTAAVAWVLTGRRAYRDRAIHLILSEGCGHYVQDSGLYAYDILYDELAPQQRAAFAAVFPEFRGGIDPCEQQDCSLRQPWSWASRRWRWGLPKPKSNSPRSSGPESASSTRSMKLPGSKRPA